MTKSELLFLLNRILSIDSVFTCYTASCVCKAAMIGCRSFAIALPVSDAIPFTVNLERRFYQYPITVKRCDSIPESVSTTFMYNSSDSVYLHFIIHS